MDSSSVGFPLAADDDATPSGRSGLPAGGQQGLVREHGLPHPRQSDARAEVSAGAGAAGPALSVLADRLAAALVHHEPGWRLPRHSALARRYNVSAAEIDAAVEELVSRHLVRRLADGQLYRASPAEYLIAFEGVPGLASCVDLMGGDFACRSRQVTWRLPPEDISWALRLPAEQQVRVSKFLWTASGEPAAMCTTYVPGDIASRSEAASAAGLPAVLSLLQLSGGNDHADGGEDPVGVPVALHIELQAPPPAVARSLRLSAGQPAMMVTVRFDELPAGRPVALTIAVLRPDLFRVVVQSPRPPLSDEDSDNLSSSWTHAVEDWES